MHPVDGVPEPTAEPRKAVTPAPSPGRLRPFDGSLPTVQTADLGVEGTRQLIDRARAEACTVQAALCAAAAEAVSVASGQQSVRINVPIDLRAAAGLDDEVVVRFTATTVVLEPSSGASFWELARSATAQLARAREASTVRASALGLAELAPSTAGEAETMMLAATAADIEVTNLGVADGFPAEQQVQALWGPTMTTQVAGEQILGVITHRDVLRMMNLTHDPVSGLLGGIHRDLRTAAG